MRNQSFNTTTHYDKKQKLKEILKYKNPSPPPQYINQIINSIDINRQYTIHVTSKIEKFKNIIVWEHVEVGDTLIKSSSSIVYGSFRCGLYQNINGTINKYPSICSSANHAAAIKKVSYYDGNHTHYSYHLVIYVPNKTIS